jgi:hypothetical protein
VRVRIYALGEQEVMNLLREADAASFEETGSHDDSRLVLSINGEERPPRRTQYLWASAQDNKFERSETDPGPLPSEADVRRLSILSTRAHYGSSQRGRAVLRIFLRSRQNPEQFLVLDLGEVGIKDASRAPFKARAVLEVLWAAKKRVRVEVQSSDGLVTSILGGPLYHFNSRLDYLRPAVALEWFGKAFKEVTDLFEGLRRLHLQRFVSAWTPEGEDIAFVAAKALWPYTALAQFLKKLG